MGTKSGFVYGEDIEACLRNASFWVGRGRSQWAWYANGDFMGLRPKLPDGATAVSVEEIRSWLPRGYWRCVK